ncbi:DNA-directed RNA polymerase subunit alpha C-terminal domain-containing protein [Chryseobacterium shigense]|uniref:ERCC4-type nuclease n=1 Tax=Chryseobacterium shigense TaxID=297244 RepID=A0A841N6S7_9FLAO|nr:DNA-directed RNA polymerase subunit alpha C-terminal domain-containing protein [Chryseobacterium shigense]MBB6370411.1 ERCC4-type nuclease [Chryseobacterium shigense]
MAKSLVSICAVNHVIKNSNFLSGIIALPARRALEREKIDSLEKLSDYSEEEIMKLHGFGRNAMQKLKDHMKEHRVSFKN